MGPGARSARPRDRRSVFLAGFAATAGGLLPAGGLEAHGLHSTAFVHEILHAAGGAWAALLLVLVGLAIAWSKNTTGRPGLRIAVAILALATGGLLAWRALAGHGQLDGFDLLVVVALPAIGFILGEIDAMRRARA